MSEQTVSAARPNGRPLRALTSARQSVGTTHYMLLPGRVTNVATWPWGTFDIVEISCWQDGLSSGTTSLGFSGTLLPICRQSSFHRKFTRAVQGDALKVSQTRPGSAI